MSSETNPSISSQLQIYDNHFPCNCRVLFLLESRIGRSRHKGEDFMDANKCISPYELNGRFMSDMVHQGLLQACEKEEILREEEEKERAREEKKERRRMKAEKEKKRRQRLREEQQRKNK